MGKIEEKKLIENNLNEIFSGMIKEERKFLKNKKNKYYLHRLKNLINMLYSKILSFFGESRDSSVIPKGVYCYEPDVEKNEQRESLDVYYTIPCKYYKTLFRGYNGCSYLGIITDDLTFDDQCKMCDVNKFTDEELEEMGEDENGKNILD